MPFRNPHARCRHRNLSHDAIALARRRARRRLVLRAAIRRLGALQLDAILLAIEVSLIRAATVVSRVGVVVLGVRGRRLVVLVAAGVVGCGGVVAGHGARGPAGAVEGLAAGFAAAARGDAAVKWRLEVDNGEEGREKLT
jgi:hypothetical protein